MSSLGLPTTLSSSFVNNATYGTDAVLYSTQNFWFVDAPSGNFTANLGNTTTYGTDTALCFIPNFCFVDAPSGNFPNNLGNTTGYDPDTVSCFIPNSCSDAISSGDFPNNLGNNAAYGTDTALCSTQSACFVVAPSGNFIAISGNNGIFYFIPTSCSVPVPLSSIPNNPRNIAFSCLIPTSCSGTANATPTTPTTPKEPISNKNHIIDNNGEVRYMSVKSDDSEQAKDIDLPLCTYIVISTIYKSAEKEEKAWIESQTLSGKKLKEGGCKQIIAKAGDKIHFYFCRGEYLVFFVESSNNIRNKVCWRRETKIVLRHCDLLSFRVTKYRLSETIYGMCGEKGREIKCIRVPFGRRKGLQVEKPIWISEDWYESFVLKNINNTDCYYFTLLGKNTEKESEKEKEFCEPPAKIQALEVQPEDLSKSSNQNGDYE